MSAEEREREAQKARVQFLCQAIMLRHDGMRELETADIVGAGEELAELVCVLTNGGLWS